MITNTIASVIVASALQTYPESPVEPLEEIMCLTEAVYFEARGEALQGLYGVALVIKNRKESVKWPDTYCGVVQQPYQFSYRNAGQPATHVLNYDVPDADKLWWSVQVALDVSGNYIGDFTGGATHYVNPEELKEIPKWLARMEESVYIGKHTYYK